MEWDDYLRQQAATYRQLAEKAEDAVVKTELLARSFGDRRHRNARHAEGGNRAAKMVLHLRSRISTSTATQKA